MLSILADADIPLVQAAFGDLGVVRTVPGREITRDLLQNVDVLLVRSVSIVDADLVRGTSVRFVGTATAGTDHVDREGLQALGVAFASAPGSNASSVVDWVLASLLAVASDRGEELAGRTLGIVGVGAVGGRLAPRARALGLEVLTCDPPRARQGATAMVELEELVRTSDMVTIHTPLTTEAESEWPTVAMINSEAAKAMKPETWLVNASRGRVVTFEAARHLAGTRPVLLDVWPDEPTPDPALVREVALATPHIAGYAWDGKVRGTQMLADAARQWLAQAGAAPDPWHPSLAKAPMIEAPPADAPTPWLDALARQAYDVQADDARFRAGLTGTTGDLRGRAFAHLRATYPERREMSQVSVRGTVPPALRAAVVDGLGMTLLDA